MSCGSYIVLPNLNRDIDGYCVVPCLVSASSECIMATTGELRLFCYLIEKKRTFSVKIARSEAVDELKKRIKNELEVTLKSIEASQLILYRVSLESDDEDLTDKALEEIAKAKEREVGKREKGLRATWSISRYFDEDYWKVTDVMNTIHVLVEVPQVNGESPLYAIPPFLTVFLVFSLLSLESLLIPPT